MFTGIVQAIGTVEAFSGRRLLIDWPDPQADDPWAIGESIAVNGCCLTLVESTHGLAFDLSDETITRTNLGALSPGSKVNLERALRAGDRLGGHLVQGHVDGVGTALRSEQNEGGAVMSIRLPESAARFLVDKGSVTINGVSLTVVHPEGSEFEVWLIPHTLEVTTLGQVQAGQVVNYELDAVAKYLDRLSEPYRMPS